MRSILGSKFVVFFVTGVAEVVESRATRSNQSGLELLRVSNPSRPRFDKFRGAREN
jgi:hypothetical protein